MSRNPVLARRFFDRFEAVHGIIYFAPESREASTKLGYPGWASYFAFRAAPLGAVSPELVTALLYNFSADQVRRALPHAWEIAGPSAAVQARSAAAAATLRRYGLDEVQNVTEATALMVEAAGRLPLAGRPMFAANQTVPMPEDPLGALWQAVTLMREHRGDVHAAVLQAEGISGRESNVFHAAAGRVTAERLMRSRGYDEDEWRRCEQSLAERNLLDQSGLLTSLGREVKARLEAATDRLSLAALAPLTDDEVERLFGVLTPIARVVVAAGDVPAATPMSLRRDELHDDSAHLRRN
jgi:hypothetical protein